MVKIKNHEMYEIDEQANVYSHYTHKYLKPQQFKDKKYWYVVLDGKKCRLHRLVAETFIPNPLGLPQVNHKDEDPSNNCVDNLEWSDAYYQQSYGTINERRGNSLIGNKNSAKYQVEQYDLSGNLLSIYGDTQEAADAVGGNRGNISRACRGVYKTYKGFVWKYKGD